MATAFVTAARTGLDPGFVLPPYAAEAERPSRATFLEEPDGPRKDIHVYRYVGATVYLDTRYGSIDHYSDSTVDETTYNPDGTRKVAKVSESQAIALAGRFYKATGWPGGIQAFYTVNPGGDNDAYVEIHYRPTWQDVPYSNQGIIYVDRQTGQLGGLSGPGWLPAPPASPVPGGTPEQARLAGLAIATPWCGAALASASPQPMELRLWYTRPEGRPRGRRAAPRDREAYALGAGHLADLRAGRAILAYQGTFLTPDGLDVTVAVDARTGATLTVRQEDDTGIVGGASRSPSPNLAVPVAARPWRVATGTKGWDAWTAPATAALTLVPGAVAKGARLTLTDGKAAFPATYDPKTGLLAIRGKAYRPGPALAALLKRRTKR